jgi:hypothetical protein
MLIPLRLRLEPHPKAATRDLVDGGFSTASRSIQTPWLLDLSASMEAGQITHRLSLPDMGIRDASPADKIFGHPGIRRGARGLRLMGVNALSVLQIPF